VNEEALAHWGLLRQIKKAIINNLQLRVALREGSHTQRARKLNSFSSFEDETCGRIKYFCCVASSWKRDVIKILVGTQYVDFHVTHEVK